MPSAFVVEFAGLIANNAGDRRTFAFVAASRDDLQAFLQGLVRGAASDREDAPDLLEEVRMVLDLDVTEEVEDPEEGLRIRLYTVQSGELVSEPDLKPFITMKVGKQSIPLHRRKRLAAEADAILDEGTAFALDWEKIIPKIAPLAAPVLASGETLTFEPADGEAHADDVPALVLGSNWGDV